MAMLISTLFVVTLGTIKLSVGSTGFVKKSTTEKYLHSLYDSDAIINDIALLKLPEAVTLSGYISQKLNKKFQF